MVLYASTQKKRASTRDLVIWTRSEDKNWTSTCRIDEQRRLRRLLLLTYGCDTYKNTDQNFKRLTPLILHSCICDKLLQCTSLDGVLECQHLVTRPQGVLGGTLIFSAYVGSGPASTVHPKQISEISSTQKKYLKFLQPQKYPDSVYLP